MFSDPRTENADFSDLVVEDAELCRREFLRCCFRNADFTGVSLISGCTFQDCDFTASSFNGVTARNTAFLNCTFRYAGFFSVTLEGCKMTGSSFSGSNLPTAAILGGDWSYTDLRELAFQKQEFRAVSFDEADLSGSSFTKCRLESCTFVRALVRGLSFRDSDIRTSSLEGVDVAALDLKNTALDLAQCILIAESTGARYVP